MHPLQQKTLPGLLASLFSLSLIHGTKWMGATSGFMAEGGGGKNRGTWGQSRDTDDQLKRRRLDTIPILEKLGREDSRNRIMHNTSSSNHGKRKSRIQIMSESSENWTNKRPRQEGRTE
jgi:hypothetical protein